MSKYLIKIEENFYGDAKKNMINLFEPLGYYLNFVSNAISKERRFYNGKISYSK